MVGERRQVLVISSAVAERDVEIAELLAEGEIVRAVERQREHCGLVAEDRRGAVPLMNVAVDHRGAARRPPSPARERPPASASLAVALGNTSRAAASVAPTERRARSTIIGDHGNPIRRCMSAGSVPAATASTYIASCTS